MDYHGSVKAHSGALEAHPLSNLTLQQWKLTLLYIWQRLTGPLEGHNRAVETHPTLYMEEANWTTGGPQ
jgi:hypothetical protein